MHTTASNSFNELPGRMMEALRRWLQRRASAREVGDLELEELTSVAHELGISAAELAVLANHNKDAADLLYRRMEQLRLDPRHVDLGVLRDLQRCCSNCDLKKLCAHELEDKPIGAVWPKYCPNEQTLAALTSAPAKAK